MNRALKISLWIGFLLSCAAVLATRLSFSYDLGLFLPPPGNPAQQILIERLGAGPASRYLFVGLHDTTPQRAQDIADSLADSEVFVQVLAAPPEPQLADMPEQIWRYRFLLQDWLIDQDSLSAALTQRAGEYALFAGDEFNQLLRADPGHLAFRTLASLAATRTDGGDWTTDDGTAVLLLETRAPAFDIAAQEQAVAAIEQVLGTQLERPVGSFTLTGVGAFSANLKQTIRAEAEWRSVLASGALVMVLLIAYRRLAVLILAGLPLLTGAVAGLTLVSIVFQQVHGITLAFGFTLLGVAIDYPLHLLSHSRRLSPRRAIVSIWPTMRLGLLSTLIAYLAIALSGAQGLAQLGLFTATGLCVSALFTRWVLTDLTTSAKPESYFDGGPSSRPRLITWPILLLLISAGACYLVQTQPALWNNDLSALSPVPDSQLKADQRFRRALGTPEMRYLIALGDDDLEGVLRKTEQLDTRLQEDQARHGADAWQTATRLLPSQYSQDLRRAALPEAETLTAMIEQAAQGTPFRASAFAPFAQDVAASQSLPNLTREDFAETSLGALLNNHLYQSQGRWVSLVSLFGVDNPQQLEGWLSAQELDAQWVDFKVASEQLVAEYRQHTLKVLLIALGLIVVLLSWRVQIGRALWSLATVLGSVMLTAMLLLLSQGPLNLYHLMALLLVAGLGLDYALFFSRPETSRQAWEDTRHALWACAASTIAAFAVLGFSEIPALQALGTTVATGATVCLLSAWLGVRATR